jgi:hypothetical protein
MPTYLELLKLCFMPPHKLIKSRTELDDLLSLQRRRIESLDVVFVANLANPLFALRDP